MGKASYRLLKSVQAEQAAIARKSKKRGLWGSIGAALGTVIAIGLTGGAAAPLMAALAAGGASWVGGKLGDVAAKGGWFNTEKAKIEGEGMWLEGERSGIVQDIKQENITRAIKTGVKTLGAKVVGKGMESFKEGKLGDFKPTEAIFERGTETPGAYGEGWEIGKGMDIKGSKIGQWVGKRTGDYVPGVGWTSGPNIGVGTPGQSGVTGLDVVDPAYSNYQFGPTDPTNLDPSGSVAAFEKDQAMLDIAERYDLDVSKMGGGSQTPLRSVIGDPTGLRGAKTTYDKYGSITGSRPWNVHDMALARGDASAYSRALGGGPAYSSIRSNRFSIEDTLVGDKVVSGDVMVSPSRPNVPLAIEDEFSDMPIGDIQDTRFSYPSGDWQVPPLRTEFQVTDPLGRMQTQMKNLPASFERSNLPVNYPAGDDPSALDLDESLFSADMSTFADRPAYIQQMPANLPQSFPVRSPDLMQNIQSGSEFNVASPDFVQPPGQGVRNLQKSLGWHKRLFGR